MPERKNVSRSDNSGPYSSSPLHVHKHQTSFISRSVPYFRYIALSDGAELVERPDAEEDFADDLFVRDTADGGGAGINGGGAVVAHDEEAAVWDLVGEGDIALAESLFGEIGFVERRVVDEDITVVIDIDPIAGAADDAFHEDFIVVIKGGDIPGLEGRGFDGEYYFPVRQGRRHGGTVNLKDRQPKGSDEDSESGDSDKGVDGTAQD